MINSRFKNCVKSAQTYPGSDVNSDHNPVVATLSCTLKKIKRKRLFSRVDIRRIKTMPTKALVSNEINKWASEAKRRPPQSVQDNWRKPYCTQLDSETDRIYQLMEKRRSYKNTDQVCYNKYNKEEMCDLHNNLGIATSVNM
ncbi:jg26418 [Pararge aegeria aegeria]|uniref:Jg26418 protein n=1 Tax=Pararge aegeria aegeria TaxID=348720 RepID=A0A8S4RUC8_9NEOP|nr:jg26418 [Pararge aegeria aegeria]